jgi:hypothetical protein
MPCKDQFRRPQEPPTRCPRGCSLVGKVTRWPTLRKPGHDVARISARQAPHRSGKDQQNDLPAAPLIADAPDLLEGFATHSGKGSIQLRSRALERRSTRAPARDSVTTLPDKAVGHLATNLATRGEDSDETEDFPQRLEAPHDSRATAAQSLELVHHGMPNVEEPPSRVGIGHSTMYQLIAAGSTNTCP